MGLMNTLDQCIAAGHEMTKAIAVAQFNDDSLRQEKLRVAGRVGEAADLIGVSSQAIRDAEKAGRLPHPDMEMRGRLSREWVTRSNRLTICGMCLAPPAAA